MTTLINTVSTILLCASAGMASDLVGKLHEKESDSIKHAAYYSALKVKFLQLRTEYINAARAESDYIQANLAAAKERLNALYNKRLCFSDDYMAVGEEIAGLQTDYQDTRVRMKYNNIDLINQLQAGINLYDQAKARVLNKEVKVDRSQDHRQQVVARYQRYIDTTHTSSVLEQLSLAQSYIDGRTRSFNLYFGYYIKSLAGCTALQDIEHIAQQALEKANKLPRPSQKIMKKRKCSKSVNNSAL